MVVACVSDKRWFDLDAVRTPTDHTTPGGLRKGTPKGTDERRALTGETANMSGSNPAGAPPLDTWTIPTAPYKGAHYATWPPELCRIPVESMCPREVCRVCGEPRRRITETDRRYDPDRQTPGEAHLEATQGYRKGFGTRTTGSVSVVTTLGWTDCHHNNQWRPGMVLDPFAGTGTTLAVATGHSRDAIGIDIDPRNADLAQQRVGMFLTIKDGQWADGAALHHPRG